MKVAFFDRTTSGHHWSFDLNIMVEYKKQYPSHTVVFFSPDIDEEQSVILKRFNVDCVKLKNQKKHSFLFGSLLTYYNEHKDFIKMTDNKFDVLVNLYFDPFIISSLFSNDKKNIVNILHWMPLRKSKSFILKYLVKKGIKLIVHTENLYDFIRNISSKNVALAKYPITSSSTVQNNSVTLLKTKLPKILYFGGTRNDKGLDILLDSLKVCHENFALIIAGKEQDFKKDYINDKLKQLNCPFLLELRYIDDLEIPHFYDEADIVVLPYRKYFAGESGVLTEAIQYATPIIVPNLPQFLYTIKKHNVGTSYECENVLSLAETIDQTIKNLDHYRLKSVNAQSNFIKERSISTYIKKLRELI